MTNGLLRKEQLRHEHMINHLWLEMNNVSYKERKTLDKRIQYHVKCVNNIIDKRIQYHVKCANNIKKGKITRCLNQLYFS